MAATTQIALTARARNPLTLWHLLSLDAPTVASLWVWFVARASHVKLSTAAPLTMAIVVWILYSTDRLLDARRDQEIEERHSFHDRHRRVFLIGIALAAAALTILLPKLDRAAIRLYLGEGFLLLAWFVVLHTTHSANRLPKEIAVGAFFSAAIFIPTIAREPALRAQLLPSAVLFAALCSLNCFYIYAWEHEGIRPPDERLPHATTEFAIHRLGPLTVVALAAGISLALFPSTSVPSIPVACSLAALLLLALDRSRHRLAPTILRAAADLALLTPLLMPLTLLR